MSSYINKIMHMTLVISLFLSNGWSQESREMGQWFRFGLANDVVFQTDKYYTNGINLEYVTEKNFSLLGSLHFFHNKGLPRFNVISLRQDIFTPQKMNSDVYDGRDRPFASYLLFGSRKTSLNYRKKLLYTSKFEVGLLGEFSGGEFVQNGVHAALPTSSHVSGWDNQVKSDLALNYGIEAEKGFLLHEMFGLSGHLSGTLGLPYTYAGTGLTLRFGEYLDYFSNLGLYRSNGWQMYVFTKFDAKVVFYNAAIQGGVYNPVNEANSPELNTLVFKVKSGLDLSYKGYNFEIGMQQVSPEFKNGTIHRWGYVSFTFQL